MKFLLDQDVYAVTARFLSTLGHDVATAANVGLAQAEDCLLLQKAHEQGRILVTRDRDFGSLVFIQGVEAGIIYLRMLPGNVQVIHQELQIILNLHSESVLQKAFVVVEPGRHRFRKIKE